METICQRCQQPAPAPHETDWECISALGAALSALKLEVATLTADLAERRARDERARELHEEAQADLARGG